MKVSAAALATLLLVATCSPAEAHLGMVPTSCCFSYLQRPIRRSFITSAYRTSSMCSLPAVILVTKMGREVCVNPKARWVQAYLEDSQLLEY
ncbi:CCL3 protein, partial [Corythaixoides concolor]|nr:CCL3 protein [Corythaixoides concolor]